jgi:hypothetical protein
LWDGVLGHKLLGRVGEREQVPVVEAEGMCVDLAKVTQRVHCFPLHMHNVACHEFVVIATFATGGREGFSRSCPDNTMHQTPGFHPPARKTLCDWVRW